MKKKKLYGKDSKLYRCKKCGAITNNAFTCLTCGIQSQQERVSKAWEQRKEYAPEMKDTTLG